MQRTARRTGLALAIGVLRQCERVIAIDVDEGVQAKVEPANAVQIGRNDLARRNRAAREQAGELGK